MRLWDRWTRESDTANISANRSIQGLVSAGANKEGFGTQGSGRWCVGCDPGGGSRGRDACAPHGKSIAGTVRSPAGRPRRRRRASSLTGGDECPWRTLLTNEPRDPGRTPCSFGEEGSRSRVLEKGRERGIWGQTEREEGKVVFIVPWAASGHVSLLLTRLSPACASGCEIIPGELILTVVMLADPPPIL